jgi:hypothetical protein
MNSRGQWSRPLGAVALLAAVMGIGMLPAVASGATATRAAAPAGTALSSCFWRGPAEGKGKYNAAFPDLAATYWTAMFSMPAGSHLDVTGSFPHARYMSLNAYGSDGVASSSIDDAGIVPDAGSTNPFLPGADRTASARSYGLQVLDESTPAVPAANTLYAGVTGQTTQVLIYRVYVADSGNDVTGGAGLPQVTVTLANGSTLSGTPMCKAIAASKKSPPALTYPLSAYLALRGSDPTFPAQDPPAFWRVFSISSDVACIYQATCGGSPALAPGQYSNLDNAYAVAMVNRGFADGPVLVLRGRMPVTPKTFGGEPTAASTVDMRYWSLCQNESLATTKVASCLDDEQVPVDGTGNYIIVTSTTHDRPKNANAACGVAWLAWPKHGDGEGHLNDGSLLLRNMLPDPSFGSAVQNVSVMGTESSVMGAYLPSGSYTSKAAFEALGCPA